MSLEWIGQDLERRLTWARRIARRLGAESQRGLNRILFNDNPPHPKMSPELGRGLEADDGRHAVPDPPLSGLN